MRSLRAAARKHIGTAFMKRFLSFAGTGKTYVAAAIAAWAIGTVGASCSKERHSAQGGLTGGESTFNIALKTGTFAGTALDGGQMAETETKVIPAAGMHEDEMANIWVLQFDASGACVRSKYYASYDPDNFPVTLSNGTAQTVAFVANTFDPDLFNGYAGTWSAFQTLTRRVSEATLHTGEGAADRYLPISGIYKGDITAAGLPAAVQMKRAVAKVRITWSVDLATAGDRFVPTRLQLCQAAAVQSFLEQQSGAGLYPVAAAENFASYEAVNDPAAGTYTWYVAENRRGTGSGSTPFDKSAETAQSGQGPYCTYVEVQGRYTFAEGAEADLSYKFYIGADVLSDYNVVRNNIYDLTVRIVGANASDARISVVSAGGYWGVDLEDASAGVTGDSGEVRFD